MSTTAFALMGGAIQNGGVALNDAASATAVSVSTLAGSAGALGAGDGAGTAARFHYPGGITTDGTSLFVADTNNQVIRKVVIATGAVTTLAGSAGSSGTSDGSGTAARFFYPHGITTDGTNLYVVDTDNQTIRKVVIASGAVTTLAGSAGVTGSADGIGTAALFNRPTGITTDGANLYVADTNNQTIRKVVIATGAVTTLAGSLGSVGWTDGTGTEARFFNAHDLTTDGTNLYVADTSNQIIRKMVIATGAVTTVAGSAGAAGSIDGAGAAAQFNNPGGITTDGTNLYVADDANTIRKVVIATGVVTTVAGSAGVAGSADGSGTAARFNYPHSITTDGANLYVADTFNHTIRATAPLSIAPVDTNPGGTSATVPGAPVIGTATGGIAQATASFTAPADTGGSAITGYTVTATPAGGVDADAGTTALTHTITGLTPGTPYTFTVTASSTIGTGAASAASNAVTPSGIAVTPARINQTLSFGAAPALGVGETGTVSASASSGLAVSFSSATPGACTVSGSTVTGVGAGTCVIAADQGGNAAYDAATQVGQSISIRSTLNLAQSWNLAGNSANTQMMVATTFGDAAKVSTVWKWIAETANWAFYTPTLADGGAAYSVGKGFDFLATVKGGEGYWVNAKTAGAVALPAAPITCVGIGTALAVAPAWNLLGNHANAPMTVADTFNDAGKVSTVWKWTPETGKWAFYTPLLADGGAAYAAGKGYDALTTIGGGEGFWVNASAAFTVPLPANPAGCGCDQPAQLDKTGSVIFPPEAFETELPVDVDDDMGSVAALYPGLDTTTDGFYPNLPCADQASIGGTLPADVLPTQGEVDTEAFLHDFDTTKGAAILEQLNANPMPAVSQLSAFTVGTCSVGAKATAVSPDTRQLVPCDDPVFLNPAMPFEGRDIIFVHGLDVKPLFDMMSNRTGPASKTWPQDASEFLNLGGYFRANAENYWRPHITEHLSSRSEDPLLAAKAGWQWTPTDANPAYVPKSNRYLLVAWSANQTIEYAQHALLTQIHLAMTMDKNVVTPAGYPALQSRPFCANGCIIVGHSTGPLITSSAMGLAQAGFFGPGGKEVARHVIAHVSFAGAISGSRIATMGMAVAMAGAGVFTTSTPMFPTLCPILETVFGSQQACTGDLSFVANSILRDLIPAVSQGVWGAAVNNSRVPTVTFAGGHPAGNQGPIGIFLPGVDDGVVTMNSACGNPLPVFPLLIPPSGFTVTSLLKAFEYSESSDRFKRGASVFLGQKNLKALAGLGYLAGACTPALAASGMVMPVDNDFSGSLSFDARRRYSNHYSFMQSLAEHSHDGGNSVPNEWPSQFGFAATAPNVREYAPYMVPWANKPGVSPESWHINVEEARAVTDASIYTRMLDANGTHLAKPLDMREIRRGRKVSFHMPFNIGNCVKQGFARWYCQRWIWKRTYHLADKWEQKQSSHYAYEFIGRR